MAYGKIIYMITYLVSLETRKISYLFNTNKYHKDDDTPRLIPVKINLATVFYKLVVCLQTFAKFSRHLEKVFHVQIFLPSWLSKLSFSLKDF